MSTGTGTSEGVFGAFPYESVITPATIAGLVVALAQYMLSLALSENVLTTDIYGITFVTDGFTLESLVVNLIAAIGTIGLFVAILAIVVSGARNDVLLVGAILTYVAGLISILLAHIYLGESPDITVDLLLGPLSPVILAVGIGIGVNWIGVDVSL